MVNNRGRVWADEDITNRVIVSKNANSLRVSIKAPKFALGNNFLTLCITLGLFAEVALTYLMIKSNVSLAILVPGFFLLGVGLVLAFVKLWLWHNFGEELINIKGNSFEMHRNYGLYKSGVKQLVLNSESELFTNRNDKWSWSEFRGKGIFRIATVDAHLVDFGLRLADEEFEMILRPIAEQLDKFKTQPDKVQFTATEQQAQEPKIAIEVQEKVEKQIEEEEEQPPNLTQQTAGQRQDALNGYLDKAKSGKVSKGSAKSKKEKK